MSVGDIMKMDSIVENMSPENRAIFQAELLYQQLVEIIENTPAYSDFKHMISSLDSATSIEMLRKFPLLTKNELLQNPDSYLRTDLDEKLYEAKTGGTSGEQLTIRRIRSEYAIENDHIARAWGRIGVTLGEDKGVVLSSRVAAKSENGFSYIDDKKMLWLACNIHSAEHWLRVCKYIQEYQPKYIRGYGSLVSRYFQQLHSHGLAMPSSLEGVAYSSDPMNIKELQFIQENYCSNIISLYGLTERVVMGATCEKSNRIHLYPSYGFTELIREDGTVIENSGEIGEVVGTSLFPRAMSLVRFRTGDLASWAKDCICECGRQMPTLEKLIGRSQETVISRHGENIELTSRVSFQKLMDAVPIGTGIQFKQEKPGHLHAFIQTTRTNSLEFEHALESLSQDFDVSFELVENPILHSNGKRTLIV